MFIPKPPFQTERLGSLMIPPWQKYPTIPLGSMGWRMGHGEEYWFEFAAWFADRLSPEKQEYAERHPEPEGWSGFYVRQGVTF